MDPLPPPEPIAPQRELFPLSADNVNKALSEISADPPAQYDRGLLSITAEDPNLSNLVFQLTNLFPTKVTAVIEGAVWTRKILNTQAVEVAQPIPVLSKEGGLSYLVSVREGLKPGMTIEDAIGNQFAQLEKEDVEMARAIKEMTKYRVEDVEFKLGAVGVYTALRRMEDSRKLGQSLKGNTGN